MRADHDPVLLSEDSGGVRTLTLNRPGRKSALNAQLWVELADALRAASKRGLSVDLGGSWLLPKLVGLQQAKRLVLLAEMIDAFVADLARRLAPGPSVALAQSKALLNDGANATLPEALANETRAQPGNFATADSTEAYAEFAEKREPAFTGRRAVPRSE